MDWIKCIRNRLLRAARHEAGITLIETLFAITIFGIISTSTIGVLTSATAADGLARQKTIGLELAQQQVEYVRQLGYADICISGGNPSCPAAVTGVAASQQKWVMGLRYTLATSVRWVNDAVPTAVATAANYKRVRVTVSRARDNKQLARVYTYVANPSRSQIGGINNAIINVNVLDYGYSTASTPSAAPVLGAQVDLWDGPSPHSSDVTDETGMVAFAGLLPNPADASGNLLTTGPTAYYDILAGLTGYRTLREDLPPGTVPSGSGAGPVNAAHLQIGPSQTQNTTVHLYRAATINVQVQVQDADDNWVPYTGTSYVDVGASYPRCAQEFSTNTGFKTIASTDLIGNGQNTCSNGTSTGEQPVSGASYTVSAWSSDKTLFGTAVQQTVPSNYPTTMFSTFVVQLQPLPAPNQAPRQCTVTFKKGTNNVTGARVDVFDGPLGTPGVPATYVTAPTNSSGAATFYLPVTGDYEIRAWGIYGGSLVIGSQTDIVVPASPAACSFQVAG